jgi:hypothetical protein
VPESLNDRAADNWRPLLAIADLGGGGWSERAGLAAVCLAVGLSPGVAGVSSAITMGANS